jgi:hypothetical protein
MRKKAKECVRSSNSSCIVKFLVLYMKDCTVTSIAFTFKMKIFKATNMDYEIAL